MKKRAGAPAVIIAPEHQSAPKVPVAGFKVNDSRRFSLEDAQPASSNLPNDLSYEHEMDLPEYSDPAVMAGMAALEARDQARSTEQTLEEAMRQHELSELASRGQRWKGQERWQGRENEQMRLVGIIHPHTFIARLRAVGIAASVDDPYDELRRFGVPVQQWPKWQARIWLNSFVGQMETVSGKKISSGRVGVSAWQQGQVKTITSLQFPYGPEWSIMRFNSHNVPTNEKYRGWRTALLELVQKEILSEAEAVRAFGPGLGPAASFYHQQMYEQRRITLGLKKAS